MSIVLFVLAACAAVASEVLLTRANPGVRLPLWRGQQPLYPTAARVLRGLAGGTAVFAAISFNDHFASWWGVLLIVVVFLPALLVRLVQNGRVPA
ncbi:MAG TPA: hypothetical protein VFF32_07610 [Dermatophilaceae bacterium]|nr:hypothetical protein [Dermatophilaceae bacterium]